jgi:hypothetical protein
MHIIVPASLMHSFCSHDDTVHCNRTSELTISEEHHHCVALDLTLPHLFSFCEIWEADIHESATLEFIFAREFSGFIPDAFDTIRGPPAV